MSRARVIGVTGCSHAQFRRYLEPGTPAGTRLVYIDHERTDPPLRGAEVVLALHLVSHGFIEWLGRAQVQVRFVRGGWARARAALVELAQEAP